MNAMGSARIKQMVNNVACVDCGDIAAELLRAAGADGKYVYDPRVSTAPIPKGDWEALIKKNNPGNVTIFVKGAQ